MKITGDRVPLCFKLQDALDLRPVEPVEVFRPAVAGAPLSQGVNTTFKGVLGDRSPVVFKHNSYDNRPAWLRAITPCREKDVLEVVTSHIFHDELGLPAVTYCEGFIQDASGQRHDGILSELVPNMRTLQTATTADITNPNQTVAETIVKGGLLGDYDVISNLGNTWLTASGQALAGDFGSAGQRGVSTLGIPKASIDVMQAYGTPERVDPVISAVKGLSDDDLRTMVERQGKKWIHDWTPAQSRELATTLIHNRNSLSHSTYASYYGDRPPVFTHLGSWAEAPAMLQMHWRNLKRYLTGTLAA